MSLNSAKLAEYCFKNWDESALPELIEYIRIPNKSPMFDPDWQTNGYMDQAVQQFEHWCRTRKIPGMQLDVVRLPGRTPLIYMDIPGDSDQTILLYGHLDKQPEMTGWRDGLGPWQPVLDGDRLYGRGGADDGYATFASLISIMALKEQGIPHARCVVIIEACEESGSYDLPFYIDALADRIGKPELVNCLDSGCGNYDQLWCTTSLRGLIGGELKIEILDEGVHSGDASGIVPSSFRILRQLLNRIDDCNSGMVIAAEFNAAIPAKRITQAGNVLRGKTSVKISLRLPPTVDAQAASQKLKSLLEEHPPYGAKVKFTPDWAAHGWHAPETEPWLEKTLDTASLHHFGRNAMH